MTTRHDVAFPRRHALALGLAGSAAVLGLPHARAQAWPDRPIRVLVGYPPGGVTDVVTRLVTPTMAERLGQPVIVENRPGAGGNLAAEQVARATPDGYTLVMGNNSTHASNPSLYRNIGYDVARDFVPVALVGTVTNVLVVHPSVQARSLQELVALAKASPGKLNYASPAVGAAGHLTAELFKLRTGTDIVHVPFRGAAPALTEMLAGRVEMMFATLQTVIAAIQAGQLRALGVTSTERIPQLPDVPTLAETVLPGFSAEAWFALFAPARTPPAIVSRIAETAIHATTLPAVQQGFERQGVRIRTMQGEALARFVRTETDTWTEVVRASGARVE
ncbi:MAG: tripartite tricarboxylate transporter substrate binding protein [Alphaproteobacteria bacterium]|nr:tripartite tricarboxylate transporter substrate binding protein [Alphaproteobacteria bacterium]